jgi:hypothetical protein
MFTLVWTAAGPSSEHSVGRLIITHYIVQIYPSFFVLSSLLNWHVYAVIHIVSRRFELVCTVHHLWEEWDGVLLRMVK